MKAITGMKLLLLAAMLGGCQTTAQDQAMLGTFAGSVANGLINGLASSGRIKPGAAAVMTGAAAVGSAALTASASPPKPPAPVSAGQQRGRLYAGRSINFEGLLVPDTPVCRQMIAYSKPSRYEERDARHFTRLYNACLASAPNHPTSRRKTCVPGKYRMSYGHPPRPICGPA